MKMMMCWREMFSIEKEQRVVERERERGDDDHYGLARVRFDGDVAELLGGKQVRCWSIRRDCKRFNSEKKSSSGNVFDGMSTDAAFAGETGR